MSESQKVTVKSNGNIVVEATVEDTYQFRWWLMSLIDKVTIINPKRLHAEFKEVVKELAFKYKLTFTPKNVSRRKE